MTFRQTRAGDSRYRVLSYLLLLALVTVGCGPSRPATYPVTGKVTYQGQPVTQGTITFYPEEGRSSMAKIQPDGSYALTTFEDADGALSGRHTVTIKATTVSGAAAPGSFEEELAQADSSQPSALGTVTWLVPESYSRRETSGLSASVEETTNTINFDLPAP